MKIKRFIAGSMREAIRMVREEQGADAVILSNRRVAEGIEVVAATDYDAALMQAAMRRTQTADAASASPVADGALPAAAATGDSRSAPAVSVPPPPAPEIQQLRREIGGMRRMLEAQVAHMAWRDLADRQPERMAALRAMTDLGLDAGLAREIVDDLPAGVDRERARFLPLGLLARRLVDAPKDPILEGGTIALIGPTGVGKTTTIAKLAARFAARHGTRDLALVTTDHYRVGAQEQLFTYGRLLGVPVQTAASGEQLRAALLRLSDRKLVLIDTAGMAPRDERLGAQFAELRAAHRPVRHWLVLSATTQAADQEDILRRFAPAGLDACVLTKLDEAARIGGVLSAVIRHKLAVPYLCDGQRVPQDLHAARPDQLVLRAMRLARSNPARVHDGTLALQFGAAHAGI
ncbi:flagellar biosynthesis protein FlhF [Sinimarinibacterium thermocellulolyticum]|uniref:Flagellar biosynthesis protein FlhF n=1 Tax=Sinimarinibacterium thermocellulolyticum TaxID=3170016 RepID=A0ABV2ABG8_9GAMM